MVKKKIIVVGGGTAGWLSALFVHKAFPTCEVTVIDSSSVDIIGVGESTTPPIINIFDFIGISIADLVKNCGATIKDSIRFTNWNGDGKYYHHGFNTFNPNADVYLNSSLTMFSPNKLDWPIHKPMMTLLNLYEGNSLDDLHLSAVASNENKIPYSFLPESERFDKASINHFERHGAIALHFNARLVAEYLKSIGIQRGITHIDAIVAESALDEQGYVKSLHLKDGGKVSCDFIFDCTGFARIFVDKTYKSKFKSYKDFLPVNKAIPFFIKNEGKTPPYTEAVSMKNGWMWKIPVEGRFGCGYVFDSNYVDDETAYKELCETIGQEPDAPRVISFTPGYHVNPWNKNVLAIGLSSGFIEPLEASSIWLTTISLALFVENISGFINSDKDAIEEYNKEFIRATDSVLNLVHMHYHNQRNDTDFWKEFKQKNNTPDSLKLILEIINRRLPSTTENYLYNVFPSYSWLIVGAGNKFFDRSIIEKEYKTYNIPTIKDKTKKYKEELKRIISNCVDHDQFLDYLRNN
jgi:tryptophan halogenase